MTTPSESTSLLDSAPPADAAAASATAAVTPPVVTEPKATDTPPAAAALDPAAQAAAAKVASDKVASDKVAADAAAKTAADANKAPEKYEPFKLPDDQAIDIALLDEFTPTLKELNLNQESAQKVINFAPRLVQATVERTTAAVMQAVGLADHAKWAGLAQADKEIGGPQFAENLAVAVKAREAFASPELTALLKQTGLGNHPEMIRMFHRVGKQISEDGFVPGGKSDAPKSLEARLYGGNSKAA